MKNLRKMLAGMSLVEMAIVLLILVLLFGGLLIPMAMQVELQRVQRTKQTLDEAVEALVGFAILFKRLPCPDTNNDGIEESTCNYTDGYGKNRTNEGFLPTATLGIKGQDAWYNRLRYRPDVNYVVSIPADTRTGSDFKVENLAGTDLTPFDNVDGTTFSRLAAVLFSCGRNGRPDNKNNESGNVRCVNSSTPDRIYLQNTVETGFDDILIWLPKNTLIRRLQRANRF